MWSGARRGRARAVVVRARRWLEGRDRGGLSRSNRCGDSRHSFSPRSPLPARRPVVRLVSGWPRIVLYGCRITASRIATGDAQGADVGRERHQVAQAEIERRDLEDRPLHRLSEIKANTTARAPGKCDVTTADAAPHADSRDPAPRALKAPATDVFCSGAELPPSEARHQLFVTQGGPSSFWRHPEGDSEKRSGLAADADGVTAVPRG